MADAVAMLTLAIWLYLAFARGRFWTGTQVSDGGASAQSRWPNVTAIVPARDEAAHVGEAIGSLLRQNYPGGWRIVLVDDQSSDGTAALARRAAAALSSERLTVVSGQPLPSGWSGKLWAVNQGVDLVGAANPAPDYLLLTDADIVHQPHVVASLVAQSEQEGLVLNSRMAKLRCQSFAERSLVPAFIFFFQMLYPFAWVGSRDRATAAAAGGCMLVKTSALGNAGGIAAMRDALIDDCALAALLKQQGPIRLSLTHDVLSVRPYLTFGEFGRMVSRSAYAQLDYSPLLLLATLAGMAMVYMTPVALALFADGSARLLGVMSWAVMAMLFQPTLRLYKLSPAWGFALPAIALAYTWFTLNSAIQHVLGKGGMWKGRTQATRSS